MLYFDKQFAVGNSGRNHTAQRDHVLNRWKAFNSIEAGLVAQNGEQAPVTNAAAIIPRDVYQEFENQSKELMREANLTLLNDLLPLATALPLGKVEYIYRKVSDSGIVTTDLDMSTPAELDKAQYSYESAIKLFHKTGFGRSWFEMEGQRSEGFDALIDDQANATRAVLDKMADHVYNGVDKSFNGTSAYGIKTSANTVDIDLDATGLNIDFTSSSATADAMRTALISIVKTMRVTNNVTADLTIYISADIESNWQRFYDYSSGNTATIMQVMEQVAGVGAIKVDRKLSGNELVGGVLQSSFIRPLVGMAVSTAPMFRANPWDNYNFVTWANVGIQVRSDYEGHKGWFYARNIA